MCKGEKNLILKCTHQNCQAKFCIKCGYNGKTNEKHILVCSLGHQIIRDEKRTINAILEEDKRGFIEQSLFQFVGCDLCGHCPKELYTDIECGVNICEACRIKMIRLH